MRVRQPLNGRGALPAAALICLGECAGAGVLDRLAEFDLNDYAVGMTVSGRDNVYVGTHDSRTLYPVLTKLYPGDFDDRVLFTRDGAYGLRWVAESGLELGALARAQTLGFTAGDSSALEGMPDRSWTVEIGPTIGWRGWPVHVDWSAFVDLLRNHTGASQLLRFSWPIRLGDGYLVPELGLRRYSPAFVDYYYGVPEAAATPGRPAYQGGAASNLSLAIAWGFRIKRDWLVSGRFGIERLDSSITSSPIVAAEESAFMSVRVAYDRPLFEAMGAPGERRSSAAPFATVRLTSASLDVDASLATLTGQDDGSIVGASADGDLTYLDAVLTVTSRQRFTAGVLDSAHARRDAASGGDVDLRKAHIGYGALVLDDPQKQLMLYAGLHMSKLELAFDESDEEAATDFSASSRVPMPMLGAAGTARFSGKLSVSADLQWFLLDYDGYSGRRLYAAVSLSHRTFSRVSFGVGYVFSRLNLMSDDAVATQIDAAYQGPSLSIVGSF